MTDDDRGFREPRREEPSHAFEQLVGIERFHEVVVAADEGAVWGAKTRCAFPKNADLQV